MSKIRVVLEAAKSLHPMAVHAYPSGGGKFTVHATGSKVEHVKKGDTVSSSDLDDLTDAGHKVKEVKRPINEKLTPEAKSAVKTALGPRTTGNKMRQGTESARAIISMAKTNKKNVVPGTK